MHDETFEEIFNGTPAQFAVSFSGRLIDLEGRSTVVIWSHGSNGETTYSPAPDANPITSDIFIYRLKEAPTPGGYIRVESIPGGKSLMECVIYARDFVEWERWRIDFRAKLEKYGFVAPLFPKEEEKEPQSLDDHLKMKYATDETGIGKKVGLKKIAAKFELSHGYVRNYYNDVWKPLNGKPPGRVKRIR